MSEYKFSTEVKIRISDINYGNHVGYDRYFLLFQEARIDYLKSLGFSELDLGGPGLIITEANCKYRAELLLAEVVEVKCKTTDISSKSFTLEYKIEKDGKTCATGYTKNMAFDYEKKKPISVPHDFISAIKKFEGIS
mgnify:CR=1 FL=1